MRIKRLSFTLLIVSALILGLPFVADNSVAYAASVKAPSQVKNLKCKSLTTDKATITWRKVSKAKGYQVYRRTPDSKWKKIATIKKVGKTSFVNKNLKAGKKYQYRVRAYKTYKNKGKTKFKYGKFSKIITITTKANNSACSHRWSDWWVSVDSTRTTKGTEARWCTVCHKYEYRDMPLKPANPSSMPIDSWIGEKDDGYIVGDTIKLTDYKGETRTFVKTLRNYWEDESGRSNMRLTERDNLARHCKDIDGTFSDSYQGGTLEFIQRNGVTISVNDTIRMSGDDMPGAVMYNGDENKLQIVVKNKMETVNSYDYDKNPITTTYVMKDGYRLVPYYGIKTESSDNGSCIIKKISVFDIDLILHQVSCGFVSGDVVADVLYDGKKLGQVKYTVNKNADASGLTQGRRDYLDVALAAIKANGGPKNYQEDMRAIKDYVYENYTYGERFGEYSSMTCAGGAAVLETYSIYKYGVYGFFGYGSQSPGSANYGTHVAFHPDTKPAGFSSYDPPNTYFEAQGHR